MNLKSGFTLILILAVLVFTRLQYAKWDTATVTNTLSGDALGYYMYLPAQ